MSLIYFLIKRNFIANLLKTLSLGGIVYFLKTIYLKENFDFSYKSGENLWNSERKLSESKKRKLLENNKIDFTSRPSMRVPGTKKFQRQPFVKTIIYEIQRCVPPR